jgi:hypothetical protein
MAEILVTEIRARRLSAAGYFFMEVRCGVIPVLLYFSPVRVPRQFAWRFNDLSCISAPRRPVIRLFFFRIFSSRDASTRPDFPTVLLLRALFSIVLALADFLEPAQSFAL